MRSFISSSERVELWVVLSLLGVLAVAEIGMRIVGPSMSTELRNIRNIHADAAKLAAQPGTKILVLGNSLALDDVRLPQLQGALPKGKEAPSLDVVAFHGAGFRELYWLFRTYFLDAGIRPDMLVMTTNTNTTRSDELRIPRMASLFRGRPFLEFATTELHGIEEWGCFLHSLAFESYASGGRIRVLALSRLVPSYTEGMTKVKDMRKNARSHAQPDWGFQPITRMFEALAEWRIRTVVVYMPTTETTEIPPSVVALASRTGVTMVDHSRVPGLGPDDFKDFAHLNEGGARKFSAILGASLASLLLKGNAHPGQP